MGLVLFCSWLGSGLPSLFRAWGIFWCFSRLLDIFRILLTFSTHRASFQPFLLFSGLRASFGPFKISGHLGSLGFCVCSFSGPRFLGLRLFGAFFGILGVFPAFFVSLGPLLRFSTLLGFLPDFGFGASSGFVWASAPLPRLLWAWGLFETLRGSWASSQPLRASGLFWPFSKLRTNPFWAWGLFEPLLGFWSSPQASSEPGAFPCFF